MKKVVYSITLFLAFLLTGLSLFVDEKLSTKAVIQSKENVLGQFRSSARNIEGNKLIPVSYPQFGEYHVLDDPELLFSPASRSVLNTQNNSYSGAKYISTCKDCTYYPVGKSYALSPDYVPNLVATGLTGGGMVTAETKAALQEMFAAASNKGLKLKANSAYRSYQTQIETFNYWVNRELAKGASKSIAEERANRYSARPGHSEHQLGTTLDINCADCTAFDRNNSANWQIWNYLKENAHKYGFVISYPENTEHLTGYVHEPWHLRYIGKTRATDFFNTGYTNGNGNYLEKYLTSLSDYSYRNNS